MKINKISSKLIKPHTPTPPNLKNYKLSFFDKHALAMNIGVVLFYELKVGDQEKDSNKWPQLEASLAKILVEFYPLAGRYIKSDQTIDCSDDGAEFIEAEAQDDAVLLDLIAKAEIEPRLFPDHYIKTDWTAADPLLSVQATRFPCGGVAVAVSVSHRVFDASSLGTFIEAWSSASSSKTTVGGRISPSFRLSSLLPCNDFDEIAGIRSKYSNQSPSQDSKKKKKKKIIVGKMVAFDKVALARLKSQIRPTNGGNASTVRVVSAGIAKALIGMDRAKHGRSRDFMIYQPVNMRERTITLPQPKHSCGNFLVIMMTPQVGVSEAEHEHIGIQELVDMLGDAIRKSISDYAEILSPDGDLHRVYKNTIQQLLDVTSKRDEVNVIKFSDWSRFGFYEADFGWGTPAWASIGPQCGSITVLMSNREGDGIEAWVNLEQDYLPYFEEIKKFTS